MRGPNPWRIGWLNGFEAIELSAEFCSLVYDFVSVCFFCPIQETLNFQISPSPSVLERKLTFYLIASLRADVEKRGGENFAVEENEGR